MKKIQIAPGVRFFVSATAVSLLLVCFSGCSTVSYEGELAPLDVEKLIVGKSVRTADARDSRGYKEFSSYYYDGHGRAHARYFINQPYTVSGNRVCMHLIPKCHEFLVDSKGNKFFREIKFEGLWGEKKGNISYIVGIGQGDIYEARALYEAQDRYDRGINGLVRDAITVHDESERRAAEQRREDCIQAGKVGC